MSSRFVTLLFASSLLAASMTGSAQAPNAAAQAPFSSAAREDTDRESHLKHMVERYLLADKFDDLDSMAAEFRRDKSRLPGGGWKLHVLYEGLDKPEQSDKDSVDHLQHLQNWMKLRPESITARVALSASLHRWAWVARGGGYANKVSDENMRLYEERESESRVILEGSVNLHKMCPQWYMEMMHVAQAEGWDQRRWKDLFDRAVQFEPTYQYFYKDYAWNLMPKWYGQPGDASAFAKASANKLMAAEGDMLYYQIASELVRKNNTSFPHDELDWARIQRGYHAVVAAYGSTRGMDNKFAYMAWQYKDAVTSKAMFASLGDGYEHSVWGDRGRYDKARDWANGNRSWP